VATFENGAALFSASRFSVVCERGLEGVVAKRLDAPYLPGVRSAASLKHKHRRNESLLVTGWLPASGKRGESPRAREPDGSKRETHPAASASV
jgi:ATP-dependent DNA ligase